jgi:hypothetical protein
MIVWAIKTRNYMERIKVVKYSLQPVRTYFLLLNTFDKSGARAPRVCSVKITISGQNGRLSGGFIGQHENNKCHDPKPCTSFSRRSRNASLPTECYWSELSPPSS